MNVGKEREQQDNQERAVIDYYNQQRRLQIQWENEARNNQLQKEADFWAKQRAKTREEEKRDREAIAKFWADYRITMQKIQDNSRPSQLTFGLL